MKRRNFRAICALLVILMLVPFAFSCGKGGDDTTTPPVIENIPIIEEEKLVIPDDHKYDGDKFAVFSGGNQVYNDFSYTSEDETVLGQAQYKRIELMHQEYDIEIELTMEVNKSSYGKGPGYQKFSKQVISEDTTYQLGLIAGYDTATLAAEGYLHDINSVPWIETSKSWWDQNANNDLTINGMLFFTNGTLTCAYSESTFVIYMNNTLAKTAIPDVDIYGIVKDGKWTIDRLSEYSRTVSEDLDGNGTIEYTDRFGLYVWDDSVMGMMGAVGTKVATVREDGTIELTLYNDNSLNMFNKFTDIAYSEYGLTYQRYNSMGFSVVQAFQENKGLFWATSNTNTPKIRDMEASFGILPYPKLNEEQTRYYSTIAPYNSQFLCIPFTTDPEIVEYIGVIVESLAYYGKTITWPACYEQTLKGAFARDEGTMDMLDIIYNNYVYDIGYYYQIGYYNDGLMNLIRGKLTTFNSMYETSRASAQNKLDQINGNYREVYDEWKSAEA